LQIEPQELKLSTAWACSICVCKLKPALLDEINSATKVDTVGQEIQEAVESKSSTVDKHLSSQDSLLFYKGLWYIPNDQKFRLKIMESFYDSRVTGHFGKFKTAERIKVLF
jgi:hypothetical protein